MAEGLFLGREPSSGADIRIEASRLRTHGVVVGMTGSGKTGLSLVLLEELIRSRVPIIAIDPKGDLGNLGLLFPDLAPDAFAPWVGDANPAEVSLRWKAGLSRWGLGAESVNALADRLDFRLYTPGSEAGLGVNLLGTFGRPDAGTLADGEARRELVAGTVSGLMGLIGKAPDPVKDPAHIVLSRILGDAWMAGEDPTLETLILRLVDPPFEKVGVFPLDRFYSPDDRMDLAMTLNGVVASSAFEPWTRGVALDLDAMLAVGEKTPVHVFSLAHLPDSERQFFLAILLGQLMAWSRRQPGTEALRAALFFDEVAGYLPPYPANPPTKAPLLTLMKQARAVGLGVVLATQNPVDLDYKALSNAGLWAIGRLSTRQDRERLLKGIDGAGLDGLVAGLQKRQFLIHQVGRSAPQVVGSRHAQCYLRGPFTRVEIPALNALHGVGAGRAGSSSSPSAPPARRPASGESPAPAAVAASPPSSRPSPSPAAPSEPGILSAPPSVQGYPSAFLDPRQAFSARLEGAFEPFAEAPRADGQLLWRPALLAKLTLRFDEERVGFVEDHTEWRVFFPLGDRLDATFLRLPLEERDLLDDPPAPGRFAPLPDWLDETREMKAIAKDIEEEVYRSETRGMFVNPGLKLYGRAGEARGAFDARCEAEVMARVDAEVAKLQERYATKADRLEDRIRRAEGRIVELEGVSRSRQLEEVVGIGETLFALFSGKKRSISRAVSKRRQTSTAGDRLDRAESELAALQEEAVALENELAEQVAAIEEEERRALKETEERAVGLEKNDIQLERFGLLWVPVSRRI